MGAKILNASAGSGKTYRLAYKYVRDVIEEPDRYRHILAVTFTNKATEEMKSRILERIHELASGAESPYLSDLATELRLDVAQIRRRACVVRSKILHDYSHFTVLTIDKFFQRILRAFIRELSIAPDYNTEIETESIVNRSADSLIEQITDDGELRRWIMEFVEERIAEGRRWDIREGILSLGGEMFKEQNRTALGVVRPKEELRRAVAQLTAEAIATREQMRQMAQHAVDLIAGAGLSVADFPHKKSGFAAYFYKVVGGEIEAYGARVRDARDDAQVWGKTGTSSQGMCGVLQPLLVNMCALYDKNIRSWNTADLLHENYRSFALLTDLYAKVRQMCDTENTMLLSETKYILSQLIGHNDAPFIYEKAGTRYERFMIDEFQDTSAREWENFLPLLQNAMSQSDQTSVLLVGDIKQSIYRWRGGDWRILHHGAQQALGIDGTEVENLRENYRSLPVVVDFNNRAIGCAVEAGNARLNALLAGAEAAGGLPTREREALADTLAGAYCDHAQTPARKGVGCVRITTFIEEPPVVECICEALDRGFAPRDILILVRTNNEGVRIAETLLTFKQRNDDPRYRFDVMTQEALTVGRAPICGFVVAALRLAVSPGDTLSLAVYNNYLGRSVDHTLGEQELALLRSVRLLAPEEAFERIVIRYALHERRDQTAYLQAIHEAVIRFCARKTADIPLFLKWWDQTGSGESLCVEQSHGSIGIMTIHKAKGLQNKVVILPYCSWPLLPDAARRPVVWGDAGDGQIGAFPVRYKLRMSESHFAAEYYRETVYTYVDNINLLYVALTRAEEALHIFIPQQVRNCEHVGALLTGAIVTDGDACDLGGMQGHHTISEEGETYLFGQPAGPVPQCRQEMHAEHTVLTEYPTSEPDLRLRLPSQRYFEGEQGAELAPRNHGILLHKAFENASTEQDIHQAIDTMHTDGIIGKAEAEALSTSVNEALSDERVREWFSGVWERVRNENEIIVPGQSYTRRPDRVMLRGARAVVVDYKFGILEPATYRHQIREYAALLQQIGYTHIEGYLWYVKQGKIEQVV